CRILVVVDDQHSLLFSVGVLHLAAVPPVCSFRWCAAVSLTDAPPRKQTVAAEAFAPAASIDCEATKRSALVQTRLRLVLVTQVARRRRRLLAARRLRGRSGLLTYLRGLRRVGRLRGRVRLEHSVDRIDAQAAFLNVGL